MSASQLALLVLLLPAAGALVLVGRGWRLPRIVTQIVGPGVVWASFVATLALFFGQVGPHDRGFGGGSAGDFTYWTWIQSGSFQGAVQLLVATPSLFMC